jgi:5-methylcytosine-specific restriction endonuclease McrA
MESNKIKGKLTKPKSHKASLHNYALANNLRCYICGSEVDYYNEEADNYREFEHLIPVSLGGNKNSKNIFIACKRCNKAKKNYIN